MKRGGTNDPDLVDIVGSNRSIQSLDALMVIREARYLSGNDLGKGFKVGDFASGQITAIEFARGVVTITYLSLLLTPSFTVLDPKTPVTIIGKESKGK